MKELVELLKMKNKTISSMESCTGGSFVNKITNIEGASDVINFSAVTYSNEYKIRMGVKKATIDTYSVYSMETAKEMSEVIAKYTNSSYGIGITGKLNRVDKNNLYGNDNVVYVSVYDFDNNKFNNIQLEVNEETREKNKEIVINEIIKLLKDII